MLWAKISLLIIVTKAALTASSLMYFMEQRSLSSMWVLQHHATYLCVVVECIRRLKVSPHSPQTITRNVEELLNDLMQQGVALVGKPVALMTKEDKIQVVRYLNDAGAFLITKSGDKVANLLNISKFTLYSYMDAGK